MIIMSPSPHLLILEDRRRAQRRSGSGMLSPKQRCLSTPPLPLVLPLLFDVNDAATTIIYSLSLHDPLPNYRRRALGRRAQRRSGSGMLSPKQRCLSTPTPP